MDLFGLLDGVQAIARTGLAYAQDPYDRERYEKLLVLAAEGYSDALASVSDELLARFRAEAGYITSKVGVSAAVFDADGNALLARRADDGLWSLVSGWVDPNETPEEAIVRELHEEIGVDASVDAFAAVFSRMASLTAGPHSMIAIVYLCTLASDALILNHELLEARFAPIESVDADGWHPQHRDRALRARDVWSERQRARTPSR